MPLVVSRLPTILSVLPLPLPPLLLGAAKTPSCEPSSRVMVNRDLNMFDIGGDGKTKVRISLSLLSLECFCIVVAVDEESNK